MSLRSIVVAILVFVIFVAGAFTAFQVADLGQDAAAQDQQSVTNESIPQQEDVWQYVDEATDEFTTGFNETVTVRNQDGNELTEGQDYDWNSTDGTIKYYDTASVNTSASGEIDYLYSENTQEVKTVSGPLGTITEAIGRSTIIAAGLGFAVLFIGLAGFMAKQYGESGPGTGR